MTADHALNLDNWLIERIAHYLERPIDSIGRDVDLAAYGMDSLYAMNMISDIEDYLNLDFDLDATTLREYPTINTLIAYLNKLLSAKEGSSVPSPGNSTSERKEDGRNGT